MKRLLLFLLTIPAIGIAMEGLPKPQSQLQKLHSDLLKVIVAQAATSEVEFPEHMRKKYKINVFQSFGPDHGAISIKTLRSTNRFFRDFINRPDVLKYLIGVLQRRFYCYNDIEIANKLDFCGGMRKKAMREWREKRAGEVQREQALHCAVEKNLLPFVAEFVAQGVNVNVYDPMGLTPLINASTSSGSNELAEILLEAGADPNMPSINPKYRGGTALCLAIENNNKPLAERLIAAKADLDNPHNNCPAIVKAAQLSSTELVDLFIKADADCDRKDPSGQTATMWAAHAGNAPMLRMLLAAKAQIDLQDNKGATALIWAVYNSHFDTTTILLQAGARTDLKSKEYGTALDLARAKKNDAIETLLLTHEKSKKI